MGGGFSPRLCVHGHPLPHSLCHCHCAVRGLPFHLPALQFETRLSLTSAPGQVASDRRVRVRCRVSSLGVAPAAAGWIRVIAGPHYHADTDMLVISVEGDAEGSGAGGGAGAGGGRRRAVECVVRLVGEAQRLATQHGPAAAVARFPAYVDSS